MFGSSYQPIETICDVGTNRVSRMVQLAGYDHLYKYRGLNGESFGFTKDIFENCRLYWPTADSLNDPFECWPEVVWKLSPNDYQTVQYLLMNDANYAHLEENARFAVISEIMENRSNSAAKQFGENAERSRCENAILSFSATSTNQLLWSHYADSHRGVCLEFTPTPESVLRTGMPVQYTNKRPIYNAAQFQPLTFIMDFYLVKQDIWAYEQEYRFFEQTRVGLRPFQEGELTGVILGARISQEHKLEVVSWCNNLPHAPQIYQATLVGDSFDICIQEL